MNYILVIYLLFSIFGNQVIIMNNAAIENEITAINEEHFIQEQRLDFVETLNQQFLSSYGYGVWAYLSPKEVLSLFNVYLNQDLSSIKFSKNVIRIIFTLIKS